MTTATGLLIKAIKQLKIPYTFIDSDEAFVRLDFPASKHFIINNTLGIISNSDRRITVDKAYQYLLLKDVCAMPKTKAYLDPQTRYQKNLSYTTHEQIAQDILANFSLPFILKKNRGHKAVHVFKIHNRDELIDKIGVIFDQKNKEYDFMLLAQEFIEPKSEITVLFYNGTVYLNFLKHQGNKIVHATESQLKEIPKIVAALISVWPIKFAGLDIIEDLNGKLWLLEVNSTPSIAHYVQYKGEKDVLALYTDILSDLKKNYKQHPLK